jgi:hypothetical protein
MGVTRTKLSFDEKYTQVPNEWVRDERLTRRARGLLVEIMSHRVGWHVTIRSLAKVGKEGRDSIQSALNELLEHGYVRRSQGRAQAGKFAEIEYELCEPSAVSGFAGRGATVSGSTVSGKSATKKNITSEDQQGEDQPEVDTAIELIASVSFDDFWSVWPRKVGKPTAERAWLKAVRSTPGEVIIAAAVAYRDNPGRPETQFIPHASTWLNREGWNDELPQRRSSSDPDARFREGLERAERLKAMARAQDVGMLA